MSKSKTGTIGELTTQAWFLEQGYDVFANVEPSGPADMLVRNRDNGKIIAVDAKAIKNPYVRADGTPCLNTKPKYENGVYVVVYTQYDGQFYAPEGMWEDLDG